MTAKEWKAKGEAAAEVVELPLPSGMVIKARRPGPMQFAAWNRLPVLLDQAGPAGAGLSDADAVEVAEFMRALLIYCCVSPRVSLTPGADEIHPREIPEGDWMKITRWAMRLEEAAAARSFRGRRANDGGGGDCQVVFVQTVGTDGDRGSGDGAGVRPGGGSAVHGDGEGRG
jgi:hypothetical protein